MFRAYSHSFLSHCLPSNSLAHTLARNHWLHLPFPLLPPPPFRHSSHLLTRFPTSVRHVLSIWPQSFFGNWPHCTCLSHFFPPPPSRSFFRALFRLPSHVLYRVFSQQEATRKWKSSWSRPRRPTSTPTGVSFRFQSKKHCIAECEFRKLHARKQRSYREILERSKASQSRALIVISTAKAHSAVWFREESARCSVPHQAAASGDRAVDSGQPSGHREHQVHGGTHRGVQGLFFFFLFFCPLYKSSKATER